MGQKRCGMAFVYRRCRRAWVGDGCEWHDMMMTMKTNVLLGAVAALDGFVRTTH